MSNFLSSLKSDLLDRRFLPVLIVLCVALLATVGYAALGGGSHSSTPPAPTPSASAAGPSSGAAGAVVITKAPETTTTKAAAETTSGASHPSGAPRNPFKPLPGAKTASATSSSSTTGKSASSSSTSSSSSSNSSSSSSSGGSTPSPAPAHPPSAPAKPSYYIHYHVTAEFGVVPPAVEGSSPQPAQLKTYTDIPLHEPLPSKAEPQVVYLGVTLKTGKDAAFALTGEAILHGSGVCKPSPTQCEAIELQAGQSETLEVTSPSGQPTVYELKLVSIEKTISNSASTARAHTASRHHHRRRHHGH